MIKFSNIARHCSCAVAAGSWRNMPTLLHISNFKPLFLSQQARGFSSSPNYSMKIVIQTPELPAYDDNQGRFAGFFKKASDHVEMDEEVGEVETAKIFVSINSPKAGTITKLLVSPGDCVREGQGIANIERALTN
ncbi:hypothetical protein V8C42DRAFT_325192 [Trichoderma barbatum]